ncbi:hypothetical protein HQN90_31930 [Paenibacillus alba]|uniref:hypothetical protein n=1 Tax=Paenibacillus alba TaxID=1197127 RepID=UPI0015641265|nr:hypothetical protein [Paenibacillus alba]NQX70756.1 hypothetical protein [Paenibacillus alba]
MEYISNTVTASSRIYHEQKQKEAVSKVENDCEAAFSFLEAPIGTPKPNCNCNSLFNCKPNPVGKFHWNYASVIRVKLQKCRLFQQNRLKNEKACNYAGIYRLFFLKLEKTLQKMHIRRNSGAIGRF